MEPKIEAQGKKVKKKPVSKQIEVPKTKVKKEEEPKQIEKKKHRSKRGSGITRSIPIVAATEIDDDPFEDCNSQRWSLKKALEHISKLHPRKARTFKGGTVTASTFESFSNTIVIGLFRLYAILERDLQNSLHIFYFGLEKSNRPRFRNLTNSLHRQNIFNIYPWLTADEKLREPVDGKELLYKRKRLRKPFSEACKQYEIEKQKCAEKQELNNVKIELVDNTMNPHLFSHDVNIPNISRDNLANNFTAAAIETQIPINQNDTHLLISQEYKNMIAAINCNYQYNSVNKSNEPQILENIPQSSDSSKRNPKKRSRWSSPPIETNINTTKIPTLETNKMNKLTPMMHFVNRKMKLITQTPLSLGDLIVLVSYYYKLEYMEQQLLIEQMKILEATKPNQAAYLRQYVRTTCPLYNEDDIIFKPLPKELIMSEINMDLYNVTCIEDILEKDFCLSKHIKIENTSHDCLDGIEPASKEFDFGSAFL